MERFGSPMISGANRARRTSISSMSARIAARTVSSSSARCRSNQGFALWRARPRKNCRVAGLNDIDNKIEMGEGRGERYVPMQRRIPLPARRSGPLSTDCPPWEWLVLVETDLQQLQAVVVVLPQKILQAGGEEAYGRRAARQLGRAAGYERDRRERSGHVAEAALPVAESLVE